MKRFFKALFSKVVIIFLVISIFLLLASLGNTISFLGEPISFGEILDGKKLSEGDYVKGELLYSYGSFASEDTVTEKNGVTIDTEKNTTVYYVIPGYKGYYGLAVGKDTYPAVDKNSMETNEYLCGGSAPTTLPMIEGRVKVMEDELLGYWVECLEENGYTQTEIDNMGEFLYVQEMNVVSQKIMTVLGLVFLLLAIIIIVVRMSSLKRKEDMMAQSAMAAQQNAYVDPYATQQNVYADPYEAQQNAYVDPYATQQNVYADPYAAQQNTYADPFASQDNNIQ